MYFFIGSVECVSTSDRFAKYMNYLAEGLDMQIAGPAWKAIALG